MLTHSGTHKNNHHHKLVETSPFFRRNSTDTARICGPADDELGPDSQSADGIVDFATKLLGAVAPAMNCVSS